MKKWLWWALAGVACASSPTVDDEPVATPDGTGGSTSECVCEPLAGSNEWETKVDIECLCDHFGCPESIDAARTPGALARVVEWRCVSGDLLIERNAIFSSDQFMFDPKSLQLTGARKYFDYVTECSLKVSAGEFPVATDQCDTCILSHGLSYLAGPGECLDPETLPDHFPIEGLGGAGGAHNSGMGGLLH